MIIFAGIDAGGTRTRVLVEDLRGTRLSEHPAVNLQHTGVQAGAQLLFDALRTALADAPQDASICVAMGVAGAGRSDDRARLRSHMTELLDTWRRVELRLFSDADLALFAAFSGNGGMIVIAGTGSIALAQPPGGAPVRAGGWGSLLGDEGSGYHLGLQGLRAVAKAYDGGPPTRLTESAPAADQLVDTVYRKRLRPADFAPAVISAAEQGDAVASSLLAESVRALSETAALLARRADRVPRRLALFGGLCGSITYRTALGRALDEMLPDWTRTEPEMTAVEAALQLAKRRATDCESD